MNPYSKCNIPQKITRKILQNSKELRLASDKKCFISRDPLTQFFGNSLPFEYKVTYALCSPEDTDLVAKWFPSYERMGVRRVDLNFPMDEFNGVCFLPKEWDGLPVKRTVQRWERRANGRTQ